MLKYPHDRFEGYVQLTDGKGDAFVPDMNHTGDTVVDAINYCRAFLTLARKLLCT